MHITKYIGMAMVLGPMAIHLAHHCFSLSHPNTHKYVHGKGGPIGTKILHLL